MEKEFKIKSPDNSIEFITALISAHTSKKNGAGPKPGNCQQENLSST